MLLTSSGEVLCERVAVLDQGEELAAETQDVGERPRDGASGHEYWRRPETCCVDARRYLTRAKSWLPRHRIWESDLAKERTETSFEGDRAVEKMLTSRLSRDALHGTCASAIPGQETDAVVERERSTPYV